MQVDPREQPQALATLLHLALLAAVAVPALQHVGFPAVIAVLGGTGGTFAGEGADPTAATPVLADLERLPCLGGHRRHRARVEPLNTAIDRLGPGFDAAAGADRPLDSWEKLDHWSLGYASRFDPFLGWDY
jgi:hypothetical protein